MASSRSLVKYSGNKALAKKRAEMKLAGLKTINSRLSANKLMSHALLINNTCLITMILYALAEAELLSIGFGLGSEFVLYGLIFFQIPMSILINVLILFGNKGSLLRQLEEAELKKLDAEVDALTAQKKLCIQNPGDEMLQMTYEDLLAKVKRSRE